MKKNNNLKKIFSAVYSIIILLLSISLISICTKNHRDLANTKIAINSDTTKIWRENGVYTFTTVSGNTYQISDEYKQELIDHYIERENNRVYLFLLIILGYPLISLALYSLYMRACVYQKKQQRKRAEITKQNAYWKELLAKQKAQIVQAEAEQAAIAQVRKNLVIFDWAAHTK